MSRTAAAIVVLAVWALAAPVPARAKPQPAAPPLPALTHLVVDASGVRAATDPDSSGQSLWVTFDPAHNRWGEPAAGAPPADADSLGSVLVFDGGLFDKFPGTTLPLGDGTTLARRDTGYALVRDTDGQDLGWPAVTVKDIDAWSSKVRTGLPNDDPAGRLRTLLNEGRLHNVPGPTARLDTLRWFGLKGGFTGGEGQFGGIVSYDARTSRFNVVRQFLLVEATVTRLLPWRDALWIGTARFAGTSLTGTVGLLQYRPDTGRWQQYSTRNSRISGDLVWDIAGNGDALWVTTDAGVSRWNPSRKSWSSWYWHRTKAGGFVLTDEPPGTLVEDLIK